MTTLFISDLHLTAERPATGELFLTFLEGEAQTCDALYILGDLFEAWLGDDLVLPDYLPYIGAMATLTASGVPLYVLHGNRDFLLGKRFCQMTGARLLDDPTLIDLYGEPTLLMHGDLLCSDDLPYQGLRSMVRDPQWIAEFLASPPEERIAFAQSLRERSREATGQKTEGIMDVNQGEVETAMARYGVRRLIHGHTHRPAVHPLQLDGIAGERLVLGDWGETASVVRCDEGGCRLETLSR